MTGNVPTTGVVLGASTAVGGAAVLLPNTGANTVFRYFLIATILVAGAVLLVRATKLIVSKTSK